MDERLAALDSHPHIEVRLFNPFTQRDWRWVGYLTDFGRLNRRMHNKSITADDRVSIVGGRNMGDEYFGAGQDVSFVDMDVLATGAVVPQVSADFDRYWSSASAYPVASLLPAAPPQALDRMTKSADALARSPSAAPYVAALKQSTFIKQLVASELALEWTTVRLVSDDPAKGLGQAKSETLVPQRLREVLGQPTRELLLVSPYFVPTDSGTRALTDLSGQGIQVSVLTNSLAATDVPAVHAGYAKRRAALLRGGVKLFELKPDGMAPRSSPEDRGLMGSSGASLHAKTFAMDGQRVFAHLALQIALTYGSNGSKSLRRPRLTWLPNAAQGSLLPQPGECSQVARQSRVLNGCATRSVQSSGPTSPAIHIPACG